MNNLPVSHQFARGWFLTREVNIVNFKLLAQLTYIDIFPLRTGFNITLHFVSQIRRTAQIVTCCGKCSCCVWYSSDAAVLYEKSSVGVPGEADENWWKHQISSTYSTVNVHFPWGHLMKWEINTHLWILQWWWHTHTHTLSPTASFKSGMLCLNPPLTGCVEELSRAKHLELSEGPQKQGLAAACRLCLCSQDGIDANGAAPWPTTCIISSNTLTTRGCLLSHSLEFYSSIVFVRRCSLQPLEKVEKLQLLTL